VKALRESRGRKRDYLLFSSRGFSLTEVLVAIGLMAILGGVALPSFVSWRTNMYYKQAAGDVVNALKTARSQAILKNQVYGVLFTTTDRSYQIFRNCSTTKWKSFQSKAYLSNMVTLNLNSAAASAVSPAPSISFSINGASASSVYANYSVRIKDTTSSKYVIAVEPSGRITSRRVP